MKLLDFLNVRLPTENASMEQGGARDDRLPVSRPQAIPAGFAPALTFPHELGGSLGRVVCGSQTVGKQPIQTRAGTADCQLQSSEAAAFQPPSGLELPAFCCSMQDAGANVVPRKNCGSVRNKLADASAANN